MAPPQAPRTVRSVPRLGGVLALIVLCCTTAGAAAGSSGAANGLQPKIEAAKAGTSCVAKPSFMRRNHMKLLKHQRDDTLRGGNRLGQFSLKECVECHASQKTHSVTGEGNFCQSCHAYAAVSIDCFECHASTTAKKP